MTNTVPFSDPFKPYEKPTDELRQVVGTTETFNAGCCGVRGGHPYTLKVQRKWIVQNGPNWPLPLGGTPPEGWVRTFDSLLTPHGYCPHYAATKTEWRDLPTVTEAEVVG